MIPLKNPSKKLLDPDPDPDVCPLVFNKQTYRRLIKHFFMPVDEPVIIEVLIFKLFPPRDGHSVLVHGSEGTDSTLLISTLAQLIMDPCCRTLEGFLALLEREWVQVSVGALLLNKL